MTKIELKSYTVMSCFVLAQALSIERKRIFLGALGALLPFDIKVAGVARLRAVVPKDLNSDESSYPR